MSDEEVKVYFKSGCGIKHLVDMNGRKIKEGDKLSWDYADNHAFPDPWMLKPIFKVMRHRQENYLCGIGINKELYLHDFRFKYTQVVS